jgi:hypothetical protein
MKPLAGQAAFVRMPPAGFNVAAERAWPGRR